VAVVLPTISIRHRGGEARVSGNRAGNWRKEGKGTFENGRSWLVDEPRGWFCRNWYLTDIALLLIFPFSR